ncbi:MAG: hypothetical protein WC846_04090 [Candidatus Gracilibacteria bacterium]
MVKLITKSAFSLIEVLLGLMIFAMFSVGIFYVSVDSMDFSSKNQSEVEAMYLAQEGLEAVRNIRDTNFLLLRTGSFGLYSDGSSWSLVSAPENVDDFYSRTVVIESVYRDGDGNISTSGDLDPSSYKVTSTINWIHKGILPRTVSLAAYLTDWAGDKWLRTTCSQFDAGVYENVSPVEVLGPPDDNCSINLAVFEEPSTFYASAEAGEHGSDVVADGNYAYFTSTKNHSGLEIVDVSDVENPNIVGNLDIGGKGRYLSKDGNYVYVGVQYSNGGLKIVDVSNPNSPVVKSTKDIGAYGNQSVKVGNNLYIGANMYTNSFRVYNVLDPTNPSFVSYLNLSANTVAIKISGSYAYVGTSSTTGGFRVIDISNPAIPRQIKSLDVGSSVNSIAINGTFAYLGLDRGSNSFAIVNISNPANPILVRTVDVGAKVRDISVMNDHAYVALDTVHSGLGVLELSTPDDPHLSYTMDVSGKGTGVFAENGYIYVTADTANNGLVVVGEAEMVTADSGIYTSQVFDTGSADTRFDYMDWVVTGYLWGTTKLQIRTADTEANLSMATWVGLDGTADTYYEVAPAVLTLDEDRTGQRYIQVKVYLTSNDGVSSPSVDYLEIGYHP